MINIYTATLHLDFTFDNILGRGVVHLVLGNIGLQHFIKHINFPLELSRVKCC